MSKDEKTYLYEREILNKIPQVLARSPLHQKVWKETGVEIGDIKSLEDFQEKVPCIDKDMVRKFREETGDIFGGLLCSPEKPYVVSQSSGTTGNPTYAAFTAADLIIATEMWARAYWGLGPNEKGLREGDYCLALRPAHHSYSIPLVRGILEVGAKALTVGMDPTSVGIMYNYLINFPVKMVFFFPSPILDALKNYTESQGRTLESLFEHSKVVGLAGEVITDPYRRRMEKEIGRPIFVTGGSTPEVGTLCMECADEKGYLHMIGDDYYFSEVTEPRTGKPVKEGMIGEHTVTNFSFEAMPVLRYKTDDLVIAHLNYQCKYGRSGIRLKFLGRESDYLKVADHEIFVSQIKEIIEMHPEVDEAVFQVVKPKHGQLTRLSLRIGYEPSKAKNVNRLKENIGRILREQYKIESELSFVTLDELYKKHSYKIPRVVTE